MHNVDASAASSCFLQLAKLCEKRGIFLCAAGVLPRVEWMLRSHRVAFKFDEEVEIIPLEEKEACTKLKSALEERDNAKAEKKDSEKTVEIEIREKNGEIKAVKAALRRKDISSDEKQQVNMRLTLLQTLISEQKEHLKTLKDNLKLTEDKVSECKKKVENLNGELGTKKSLLLSKDTK